MRNRLTWSFAVSAIATIVIACPAQEAPLKPTTAASAATTGPVPEKDSVEDLGTKSEATAYQVGGSVVPPIAIRTPSPKYSKEAKEAKFSGQVIVSMIVGTDGEPRNVHILRGVGMGLDEEAMKAVENYRFKPATRNGKPVAVYVNVKVNFQIKDGRDDRPVNNN